MDTPNKTIRTIILGLILITFLGTTIYAAITKDENKLVGKSLEDIYYDQLYDDDYYDDYDDYYDDYDDYYDDYEDDYYDEFADGELDKTSTTVTQLYDYVKLYPYVQGLKDSFKVSDLTEEEKMRLVMASLKSKKNITSQPVTDVEEKTIVVNDKTYTVTTPNIRYKTYQVSLMYSEVFGTTTTLNYSTLMYDGDDIVYKYNESATGYIQYVSENKVETSNPTPEIVKAERKNKNIEIHIKAGTKTEIYIFELKSGYNYIYQFVERKSEQPKNSL